MAVTTSPITNSGGIVNRATGGYSGTGSGGVTIDGIGFVPTKVVVIDVTAPARYSWYAGMGAYMLVETSGSLAYTDSLITTDWGDESVSETGIYAPGTSEAGDGSLIDTTVEIELDVNPPTYEVGLASALNTSAHVYLYEIEA